MIPQDEIEEEQPLLEENEEEAPTFSLKLDYSLKTPEERADLVNRLISTLPKEKFTPKYSEYLTEYILDARPKVEKHDKSILTNNRLFTVNKRETSFEGICSKLENGEDGLYNMMSDLGKHQFLDIKDPITEKDLAEMPELQELQKAIDEITEVYKHARGKRKYLLKKQLIEMQRDRYVIRNDLKGTYGLKSSNTAKALAAFSFYDDITFDADGNPVNNGPISFFNPDHIEALLCNYSDLKECAWGNFDHDLWYLMEDLDRLIEDTLPAQYPLYYDLLIYKIDGLTNLKIQELLEVQHGIKHSVEYISALWRNKIPKLLADKASEQYLEWYYTYIERGKWKRCSRCGQVKLAHNHFFSRNNSSKDGYYSICKCCRNANSKKNAAKVAITLPGGEE